MPCHPDGDCHPFAFQIGSLCTWNDNQTDEMNAGCRSCSPVGVAGAGRSTEATGRAPSEAVERELPKVQLEMVGPPGT